MRFKCFHCFSDLCLKHTRELNPNNEPTIFSLSYVC
nr:MAG TPA: hypothetical protein [Caudoviricetes sp.]